MVLSDLVLSYQEHGGDANAGEESGRALLSALQRVSRDHVRDCFSGENGSGEAEMMVATEATLLGRMILMRWHFSAVEATHVQSLVSALFVAVVGSGNSDIETVAQRLEESLRCEHWRREEVAKLIEHMLNACTKCDLGERAAGVVQGAFRALVTARTDTVNEDILVRRACHAYETLPPKYWPSISGAAILRSLLTTSTREAARAAIRCILNRIEASPGEKSSAVCELGPYGTCELAIDALLAIAKDTGPEGVNAILGALTMAASADAAWVAAMCTLLRARWHSCDALLLAVALHMSTIMRDRPLIVGVLEALLSDSADWAYVEFGINIETQTGGSSDASGTDMKISLDGLLAEAFHMIASVYADVCPTLLKPLLSLGTSLLERKPLGEDRARRSPATMGAMILSETFGAQPAARRAIVTAALARSTARHDDVASARWLDLLSSLCRLHPAAMLDSGPLIQASLGEIGRLPAHRGAALLLALWPLHSVHQSFTDHLLVSLRRAGAVGTPAARALACRAVLQLIVEELDGCEGNGLGIPNGISPASGNTPNKSRTRSSVSNPRGTMSQRSTLGSTAIPGVSLFHELLAVLRRAEQDEAIVLDAALEGLPNVLRADPTAAVPVLEWLLPRFTSSCHGHGTRLKGALRLDDPSSPSLLRSTHFVLRVVFGGTEEPPEIAHELRSAANAALSALSDSALEDWGLDRESITCEAERACVLRGCLASAIEISVSEVTVSSSSDTISRRKRGSRISALFSLLWRLDGLRKGSSTIAHGIVPKRVKADGGQTVSIHGGLGTKERRKTGVANPESAPLSARCLSRLLDAVIDDGLEQEGDEGAEEGPSPAAGPDSSALPLGGTATTQAHRALARNPALQLFVLQGTQMLFEIASRAHPRGIPDTLEIAISGTQEWHLAVRPLIRAAKTMILARSGARTMDQIAAAVPMAAASALRALTALIVGACTGPAMGAQDITGESGETALLIGSLLSVLTTRECAQEAGVVASALQILLPALTRDACIKLGGVVRSAALAALTQRWSTVQLRTLFELALKCSEIACDGSYEEFAGGMAEVVSTSFEPSVVEDPPGETERDESGIPAKCGMAMISILVGSLGLRLGRLEALYGSLMQSTRGSPSAASDKWIESVVKLAFPLAILAGRSIPTGPACDALVRTLRRVYRALSMAAKGELSVAQGHRENTEVRDALSRAIAWINGKLTPVTYAYIGSVEGDAENAEPADAKSHKRALSTRLRREGRIVPDLIFAIEDYERQLLRLSRAGRLNLTHVAKRATNRDFRVRLN